MSDAPKLIEARAFWHGGSYFERHRAIDQSELEYGYTKYVRKDITDELAEALAVLDREFADQAIADAEYLAEEGSHAMQEYANRSASLWLKARAALAKYKETET